MLDDVITHVREDIEKIDEAEKLKVLFETTAESTDRFKKPLTTTMSRKSERGIRQIDTGSKTHRCGRASTIKGKKIMAIDDNRR